MRNDCKCGGSYSPVCSYIWSCDHGKYSEWSGAMLLLCSKIVLPRGWEGDFFRHEIPLGRRLLRVWGLNTTIVINLMKLTKRKNRKVFQAKKLHSSHIGVVLTATVDDHLSFSGYTRLTVVWTGYMPVSPNFVQFYLCWEWCTGRWLWHVWMIIGGGAPAHTTWLACHPHLWPCLWLVYSRTFNHCFFQVLPKIGEFV